MRSLNLTDSSLWEWRQSPEKALADPEVVAASKELLHGWKQCVQMPSQIHCELLAKGEIADPFLKLNEQEVQWVGETDWLYRCSFEATEVAGDSSDLVFEGLDTFATVWLNGKKILTCDNMFTPQRISVDDEFKNTLLILFTSSFIRGRIIEEEHLGPDKHLALWNGDPSRLWVRKAGYEYGWDWGPCLCSAGPWKPIRLEVYKSRITDFNPNVIMSEALQATLTLDVATSSLCHSLSTNFTLLDPSGPVIRKFVTDQGSLVHSTSWTLAPGGVELWWSVGLGPQPLYTYKAELFASDGTVLDSQTKKIGVRRLRVVQEPLLDQPGTSFCFEINNIPIFCGGSNWISIDAFIVNATRERYRAWLELLVAGHQNMIRAWGGGVYEHDDFYDICDELGILVWQDFQFGCGQYPAHPAFIASVKAEAEANVLRIRHHASLAIFAGNSEDYQLAESMHLEYDPKDHHGDWSKTTFPAREIYERTLPEVVHRLCDVYYHSGSPWGGKDMRDSTVGDIHQWNVWHGSQQRYQDWDQLGGRFVSEFGMQGFPDIRTTDYFLDGDTSERYPQSKTIGYHNKADGYERRLELYLVENIRHAFDLESYIYATQLIQAVTLSTAYRLRRREFKGPGRAYCAGALVWQLNDYPCTSWSIVDYFLRPKPAYYSIKQSMMPIAVGMKRYTERTYPQKHSVAIFDEKHYVEIWAANSTLVEQEVVVVVESLNLLTGRRIYSRERIATLCSNRSTELEKIEVPVSPTDPKASIVVSTKLVDPETNAVLSRFSTYPEPYKFLTFPAEDVVKLQVASDVAQGTLTISAATPVKGLILSFDTDVTISDNALDLIPGDVRVIAVKGLEATTKILETSTFHEGRESCVSCLLLYIRNNKFGRVYAPAPALSNSPTRMWGSARSPPQYPQAMSVIHKSHWPSVGAIPELSLAEFICSNPFAVPDERVIVIEGGGTGRLTYKNYTDSIRNVAAGIRLVLPELSSGDVVCVLSPNTLTYPSLILGISGAGCVPAMVNPSATPQELAHSCKSLITFKLVAPNGLKALFCHPSLMDGALEGLKLTGFTKQPRLLSMIAEGSRGLPTVEEVTEAGRLNPRPLAKLTGPAESTLAMLFYSSGTTGAYKGVMLSHQNLIANAMQIIRTNVSQFLPTETMQSFLPLYHIYGTCLAILACAIAGTPTVHLHKFDLELFLSSIQEHKTTQVFIVPPVAVALAKHPIVDKYDLSSLKIISIAAAPTKLDLVQQLRRRLKVKVVQGYGMTEASPGTHQLTPDHEHHDGSVGQLYPDMECRLVNDDGVDVGDEEEGEIVLRGPNIMLGYIGDAEATADTVRDGWLHTGDIGRRSKDGFYWIVDRKKELIKVRGLQVAPADLESILLASPLVLDCAVTATYDEEKATELPRAFVVVEAKNRNDETIKALHALVDGQVAYYKRIAGGIFFLDEIPKNPSGKILRRLLPRDIGTNVKAKL